MARLGGDEFVVLLESPMQREQMDSIAQKLVDSMREPWFFDGHLCAIGLSMGISVFPANGSTADALLTAADTAMYRVKNSRRNGFDFVPED
jgi:diguanylate cyclase